MMEILLALCHYLHLLLLDVHAICARMWKKDYMIGTKFSAWVRKCEKKRPFALISYSPPTLRLGVTAHAHWWATVTYTIMMIEAGPIARWI